METELTQNLPEEVKVLGTPIAIFETRIVFYLYAAFTCFLLGVAFLYGAIGVLLAGGSELVVQLAAGGMGGLVGGVVLLRKIRRMPRLRILVSSHGLACMGEKTEVVLWRDVNRVIRVDRSDKAPVSFLEGGAYQVILISRDGRQSIFNETLSRFRDFAKMVKDHTLPHMLPPAIEAFKGGAVIGFGEISVSREGLQIGRETLPWELFDSAEVSKGRLTVYDSSNGKKRFGRVDISKVPNAHVFLALAEYAARIRLDERHIRDGKGG